MVLKDWKSWSFIFIMVGSIQFIILTFIAMVYYKGGTYIDPDTPHYIFWNNLFSDLGRTIAHSGITNRFSFTIFTATLLIWGVSHIPFYIAFSYIFGENNQQKQLSIAGSIFGVLTGISYMGIALTPSDILNDAHNFFVIIAFSSIFICIIIYSLVIYHNKFYSNFYFYVQVLSAIILAIFYISLLLVPDKSLEIGLFIQVVGQKIAMYTLLISGFIQGYGALKKLKFL